MPTISPLPNTTASTTHSVRRRPKIGEIELYRPLIKTLYLDRNWTLKQIKQYMISTYGFHASDAIYKALPARWDMCKNSKAYDKEAAIKQLSYPSQPGKLVQVNQSLHTGPHDSTGIRLREDKLQRYLKAKHRKSTKSHDPISKVNPSCASVPTPSGSNLSHSFASSITQSSRSVNISTDADAAHKSAEPHDLQHNDKNQPLRSTNDDTERHNVHCDSPVSYIGSEIVNSDRCSTITLYPLTQTTFSIAPESQKKERFLFRFRDYTCANVAQRYTTGSPLGEEHASALDKFTNKIIMGVYFMQKKLYAEGGSILNEACTYVQNVVQQQHWRLTTTLMTMFSAQKWKMIEPCRTQILNFIKQMTRLYYPKNHILVEAMEAVHDVDVHDSIHETTFQVVMDTTRTIDCQHRTDFEVDYARHAISDGHYEQGVHLMRAAIAWREVAFGAAHEHTRHAVSILAQTYLYNGQVEYVRDICIQALELGVKIHGEYDYDEVSCSLALSLITACGGLDDLSGCENAAWALLDGISRAPEKTCYRTFSLLVIDYLMRQRGIDPKTSKLASKYHIERNVAMEMDFLAYISTWPIAQAKNPSQPQSQDNPSIRTFSMAAYAQDLPQSTANTNPQISTDPIQSSKNLNPAGHDLALCTLGHLRKFSGRLVLPLTCNAMNPGFLLRHTEAVRQSV